MQTRNLACWLIERGHAVQVVTQRETHSGADDDFLVTLSEGGARGRLTRYRRIRDGLRRMVEGWSPDIVHVQTCTGPISLWAGWVARAAGVPAMIKFSSDWDVESRGLEAPFASRLPFRLAQRLTFSLYSRVWVTTNAYADRARRLYGVSADRVLVAPNPVGEPPAGFVSASVAGPGAGCAPLRLVCVARLKPAKGLEDLIDAMARMPDGSVLLRIVGDGEAGYRAGLEARIRSRGLSECVELTGAIDPARIWDEYARADAFVSASRYEPFGIVMLEAMRAGLPVIATATDGASGIVVDRETGVLVPVANPARLAEGISKLATDAELRRAMGAAAAHRVRLFSEEAIFTTLERTFVALHRGAAAHEPGCA